MLTGVLLVAVGCRGGSGAPGDSADTNPAPVTWTAEQCGYFDPEYEEPTGTTVSHPLIPGCPIVLEEGWKLSEVGQPGFDIVVCQSGWTWEEAREAGLLAALQIPEGIAPGLEFRNECEEVSTGQPIWTGGSIFFVDSGKPYEPSEGGITWYTEEDGRIRSVYLEYPGRAVSCGGRHWSATIVFGEPLFTPDPRYFTCKPGT